MVVKALWCARCAPGCSAQDRRHPVSALLARGWEQQTMKQAITIKTDKSYERENTWDCPRNTVRSLGWLRDSRRRLWGKKQHLPERPEGGRQEVARGKGCGGCGRVEGRVCKGFIRGDGRTPKQTRGPKKLIRTGTQSPKCSLVKSDGEPLG